MVEHDTHLKDERTSLGDDASRLARKFLAVGVVALVLSILAALLTGGFDSVGVRRFLFAYLIGYLFSLSIAVGALAFILIQHTTRSGWSTTVRRGAETMAATFPTFGLLAIPLLVSVALNNGYLYRWAQPDPHHGDHHAQVDTHADEAHAVLAADASHDGAELAAAASGAVEDDRPDYAKSIPELVKSVDIDATKGVPELSHLGAAKQDWLTPWFFIVRVVVYIVILSAIARWFWRVSIRQDSTGEVGLTLRRQFLAPPLMIVGAFAVTFIAFDLIMSLDPEWYSTIFGMYFFSGSMVAFFATLILVMQWLQRRGYLVQSVTTEHYHDMGKLLFAFTFFWGYIAFSQYMLLWYAQMPETIGWLSRRGATSVAEGINGYTWILIALAFGHLLIPFAGLLSRHVKRNRKLLAFWAVWMLVAHFFDLVWLVLPEYSEHVLPHAPEVLAVIGIGGIFLGSALKVLGTNALRPLRDPRLGESLAFQNI